MTSVVVDSKSLVSGEKQVGRTIHIALDLIIDVLNRGVFFCLEPRGIDDAVPVSAATMAVTTNTHPVTATPIVNNNSQLTPHQQATIDLRQYILSTLAVKMDDLKSQMSSKISAQEEVIQSRLKSLEGMLSGTTAGAGDEALANDKASAKTKKDLKKK